MYVSRFANLLVFFIILPSCAIESSIPSGEATPSIGVERAVTISQVITSGTGHSVTCLVNEALVDPSITVDLFLEFEGSEVQRTTMSNQENFTFNEYNPPTDGNILCVVVYSGAEFESAEAFLARQ